MKSAVVGASVPFLIRLIDGPDDISPYITSDMHQPLTSFAVQQSVSCITISMFTASGTTGTCMSLLNDAWYNSLVCQSAVTRLWYAETAQRIDILLGLETFGDPTPRNVVLH